MAEQEDIKAWIILGPTDRGWDPVFVVIGTRADAKAKGWFDGRHRGYAAGLLDCD